MEHQWGYEIPKQDDMWWGPHVIHRDYKTRYARWTTQSASREERRQADKWVPNRFPTQSSSVGSTSSVVPRIVPLLIIRGRPLFPPRFFQVYKNSILIIFIFYFFLLIIYYFPVLCCILKVASGSDDGLVTPPL